MTSAGLMASGVNLPVACTQVLQEPFNTLSNWTNPSGQFTIITGGRTGKAARAEGDATTGVARYSIATTDQKDTITMGFIWQVGSLTGDRYMLRLESDAGATSHIFFIVFSTGMMQARRGTAFAPVLLSTPAGILTPATWNYIELKVKLHDTQGTVDIRVNEGPTSSATGLDTRNGGTKTVFDTVCLLTAGGTTFVSYFDDMYIMTGSECTFQGDHPIP
jgi:hypothetical protein